MWDIMFPRREFEEDYVPLNIRSTSTRLHGAISQKAVFFTYVQIQHGLTIRLEVYSNTKSLFNLFGHTKKNKSVKCESK
jgi:hypothetical protein